MPQAWPSSIDIDGRLFPDTLEHSSSSSLAIYTDPLPFAKSQSQSNHIELFLQHAPIRSHALHLSLSYLLYLKYSSIFPILNSEWRSLTSLDLSGSSWFDDKILSQYYSNASPLPMMYTSKKQKKQANRLDGKTRKPVAQTRKPVAPSRAVAAQADHPNPNSKQHKNLLSTSNHRNQNQVHVHAHVNVNVGDGDSMDKIYNNHTKLKFLYLNHCEYIGSELNFLVPFQHHLMVLEVKNLPLLCDSSLVVIGQCNKLNKLILSECLQVTDSGLMNLANLLNLEILYLDDIHGITDVGLQQLTNLTNLTELSVNGCVQVQGMGLESLTHLPLSKLNLGHTSVRNSILNTLLKFSNHLISLDVHQCNLTEAGFWVYFHKLSKLKSLFVSPPISESRKTDFHPPNKPVSSHNFFRHFMGLPSFQEIILDHFIVDEKLIQSLKYYLPYLRKLTLTRQCQVTIGNTNKTSIFIEKIIRDIYSSSLLVNWREEEHEEEDDEDAMQVDDTADLQDCCGEHDHHFQFSTSTDQLLPADADVDVDVDDTEAE